MSSPIIQATISACVLTATSNIAAQLITAYRNDAPYTINWLPVLQFVIFTALNSPPNFLWQQFLESSFPSHPPSASAENPPRLSPLNTALKFTLDQSLGAALNTLAFSLAMGAFAGLPPALVAAKARREFWPLMRAGWRLWPVVSLVNFVAVRTVRGRALVGSVAGVGWGVYLSLVAGGGGKGGKE